MAVFCDWLDVTYAPGDLPLFDLNVFLLDAGFVVDCCDAGAGKRIYKPLEGFGALVVQRSTRFGRVSASGSVLELLRASGRFLEYLSLLGDRPHKVTRLDAALDLDCNGGAFVRSMHERYPSTVALGRKALATTVMLQAGHDGRQTGTWYAGHRSAARVSARVYDKAWEIYCRTGAVVDQRARVEITFRKDFGATLRDAAEPTALFWGAASPAILEAPEVVPMRLETETGWDAVPRPVLEPAAVLARRIECSPELEALADIADSLGPQGRVHMARLLLRRLGVSAKADKGDGDTVALLLSLAG